jgi:hypothetical protein
MGDVEQIETGPLEAQGKLELLPQAVYLRRCASDLDRRAWGEQLFGGPALARVNKDDQAIAFERRWQAAQQSFDVGADPSPA